MRRSPLLSEEEFDRRVAALDRDIPGLTDAQILVGMMTLVRHLDDGHAGVRPPAGDNELSRLLPLDFFLFPEGLFVIGAGPGYEDLLGARVERIGRLSTGEAIAALDPVIVRDNEQQVTFMVTGFLCRTAVLQGLGIIDDLARASLAVCATDGTSRVVVVDAEPGERLWDRYPPGWAALADSVPGRPRPLHLRHRELPYWFEYLPAADLVYFQFNAVRDHPAEAFGAFCDRLFGFIADRRPSRLVIDLRWNGGGNTFLTQPLLHHLIACPEISRRGALFVDHRPPDLLGRAEHRDRHRPRNQRDLRRRADRVPPELHRGDHLLRAPLQQGPGQRGRPVLADLVA